MKKPFGDKWHFLIWYDISVLWWPVSVSHYWISLDFLLLWEFPDPCSFNFYPSLVHYPASSIRSSAPDHFEFRCNSWFSYLCNSIIVWTIEHLHLFDIWFNCFIQSYSIRIQNTTRHLHNLLKLNQMILNNN